MAERLRQLPLEFLGAAGAAGLMIIGAIGPWAKVLFISVSGIDGTRDGWIVLVLAGLALAALVGVLRGASVKSVATGLQIDAVIAGGVAVYDWSNLPNGSGIATVSPGWGLYLTIAASVALLVTATKLANGAATAAPPADLNPFS
jgi:hypothetical protein